MIMANQLFKPCGPTTGSIFATALVLGLMSCGASDTPTPEPAYAQSEPVTVTEEAPAAEALWSEAQLVVLERWVSNAPAYALPVLSTRNLDTARTTGDSAATDAEATELALDLARMHLLGTASVSERKGWHITDTDAAVELPALLEDALTRDDLENFFKSLQPTNPDYAALRKAYANETDPARRDTIARNLERWRWMPRSLGGSYVLVNQAAFEASLWRDGKREKTWRVIVGKPSTPSPVFSTTITGVTFNPWWNIPASIVREMKGRFPASKGYVRTANGWAQKPGPGNALGQMKLVMPNPFSVYMHDTPGKSLFEKDVRAFSHGCIRTGDAIDYGLTLLDGKVTRAEVDAILASRKTTTIALPRKLPVYITYFTAGTRGDGRLEVFPDIYGRDGRVKAAQLPAGFVCEE